MASPRPLLFAGLVALAGAAPASAQPLDTGWWVVLGSFPSEPAERQQGDRARVGAAAKRCSLATFNDLSEKFVGFAPGYNVFVVGAFASREAADAEVRAARRCFPDAYVKYGEYLGE